jgi:hypothetical protein
VCFKHHDRRRADQDTFDRAVAEDHEAERGSGRRAADLLRRRDALLGG